jgi:ATP-dependent helicase/nuclease subunit A
MIKLISAGAGSGKTYRLTQEMVGLLKAGTRASGIIATTFTAKAAAELEERVRTKLLEEGLTEQANDLSNALIGTVHGLGVKLLKRFAFEAGVSPQVSIIADEDSQLFFNQSLAQILTQERVERINELCDRLGLTKKAGTYDWRRDVRTLVDVARANAFDKDVLEISKKRSFESFQTFLGGPLSINDYNGQLLDLINATIELLETSGDTTKVTSDGIGDLKTTRNELRSRGSLHWHQWVKLIKTKVGAKAKQHIEPLVEFCAQHTQFPEFQADIREFIYKIFEIATEAILEFERFKSQRGLIDYTDMEVLVRELIQDPSVKMVLADELDLLMVDEFQDTSPIQLDLFLKLSKIAKHSIWVGDPKQSIYGFRGAEPRLMQAVIEHVKIKDEDILKDSWRSRPDVVFATNALFDKAFVDLPVEQIALNPMRKDGALQANALQHWHFLLDNGGDKKIKPNQAWFENCLASTIAKMLERQILILPKGEKDFRAAVAGDIAILCRTNAQAQGVAEALHRAGLKAAIARTGLLETAEAALILAVLRYILNRHDSLAVAEILLLSEKIDLSEIIEHRLNFVESFGGENGNYDWRWAHDNDFIKRISDLRRDTVELSANEILNLILEELDLRRIIASWGSSAQRLENVDVIRKFSLEYENACNRLHTAASLGGFLLWLANRAENDKDTQSSGEGADAVNVLTYHRSKGLEYPIVVLGNLEQSLRDDVFGVAIQSDKDEVDLNDILGNRWLRFWVNPYADQIRGTELHEKLESSAEKSKAKLAALSEEARLLYVGVTRARDYLVFPTYQGGVTKWLNRAWHNGNEEFPTLDDGIDTVFEWNGASLIKDFEEFWFEKEFGFTENSATERLEFIEQRHGKHQYLPYKIDFEKGDTMLMDKQPKNAYTTGYSAQMVLKEDAKPSVVIKSLEAFMRSDTDLTLPDSERLALARTILARFEATDMVDYQWFVQQSNKFNELLKRQLDVTQVIKKYPIRGHYNTRYFEYDMDILAHNKLGEIILIMNDPLYGDLKRQNTLAKDGYGPRLHAAGKKIAAIFNNPKIRYFVHYPLNGAVVEIEF